MHVIGTTQKPWLKFIFLVGVLFLYYLYMGYEYGFENGTLVTLLTWSFFVLCTPVADAGFLLDFPIRLLYKVKMVHTEILVWVLDIFIVSITVIFNPAVYEINALMKLFHQILINPIPYWFIIVLCCIGTFMSIIIGDNIYDTIEQKDKKFSKAFLKKMGLMVFLVVTISYLYYHLIENLGIQF